MQLTSRAVSHAHTDTAVTPCNSAVTPRIISKTPFLGLFDWGLLYGLGRPSNSNGLRSFKSFKSEMFPILLQFPPDRILAELSLRLRSRVFQFPRHLTDVLHVTRVYLLHPRLLSPFPLIYSLRHGSPGASAESPLIRSECSATSSGFPPDSVTIFLSACVAWPYLHVTT